MSTLNQFNYNGYRIEIRKFGSERESFKIGKDNYGICYWCRKLYWKAGFAEIAAKQLADSGDIKNITFLPKELRPMHGVKRVIKKVKIK